MMFKGYIGHVEYDEEAEILHGEVINTRDVITSQTKNVSTLKKAFRDSIEDYLAFCVELGQEPGKPYSGQFLMRIDPELHRHVSVQAKIDKTES